MPARAKTRRDREPWHVRLHLKPLSAWMTLGEAAYHLGISRQAVHRLVERGSLPARTIGSTDPGNNRPIIVVRARDVEKLPMSPQRRREFELRAAAADEVTGTQEDDPAELGDELPEG